MTDITDRLRDRKMNEDAFALRLRYEAADEIERMQEFIDLKQATIIGLERKVDNQRVALQKLNEPRVNLKSAERRLRNMGYSLKEPSEPA